MELHIRQMAGQYCFILLGRHVIIIIINAKTKVAAGTVTFRDTVQLKTMAKTANSVDHING